VPAAEAGGRPAAAAEKIVRAAQACLTGRSIASIVMLHVDSPGAWFRLISDLRDLRAGAALCRLEAGR
jgi:hypothetical protein